MSFLLIKSDSHKPLTANLKRARDEYQKRFGTDAKPNTFFVNPLLLRRDYHVAGVNIVGMKTITLGTVGVKIS